MQAYCFTGTLSDYLGDRIALIVIDTVCGAVIMMGTVTLNRATVNW